MPECGPLLSSAMASTRSHRYGWHPDRPWDSHRFSLGDDGAISTTEVALALGLADGSSVRALIDSGWLAASRDGRRWRVWPASLEPVRKRLIEKQLFCTDPAPDHRCRVVLRSSIAGPRTAAKVDKALANEGVEDSDALGRRMLSFEHCPGR